MERQVERGRMRLRFRQRNGLSGKRRRRIRGEFRQRTENRCQLQAGVSRFYFRGCGLRRMRVIREPRIVSRAVMPRTVVALVVAGLLGRGVFSVSAVVSFRLGTNVFTLSATVDFRSGTENELMQHFVQHAPAPAQDAL